MNSIFVEGISRVENRTKNRLSKHSSFCPETLTKYYVHEFHLSFVIKIDLIEIEIYFFTQNNSYRIQH
jgi:hypothetical protein